jgi:cell division protein FtsW
MAFGSGGIYGAGIGDGFQKLFYLPESHTDFIFSIVGEELGLIGVFVILCLYGVIIFRGFQIALKQVALFPKFLAIGLTTTLAIQICVNMGVALALLPTKGLALPFLSYGGTSLLLNMLSIGILMKISSTEAK